MSSPNQICHANRFGAAALVLCLAALAGCGQEMADQAKLEPLEESSFFPDGEASRPEIAGTIARGHLQTDEAFFTGKSNGRPVAEFPEGIVLDGEFLRRGQQRYNIYCSPCHDRVGTGRGMAVRRGYPLAEDFQTDEMRQRVAGSYFDVMTNGFRNMPSYASQISPRDRWAIIAYIRALQLSQRAPLDTLSPGDRQKLEAAE